MAETFDEPFDRFSRKVERAGETLRAADQLAAALKANSTDAAPLHSAEEYERLRGRRPARTT